jgi:hypothetical protein
MQRFANLPYKITYKDFPECQNFQASAALARHAEVVFPVYTSIVCGQNDYVVKLLPSWDLQEGNSMLPGSGPEG